MSASAPLIRQGHGTPSSWVTRHTPLFAQGAEVLDVACGHGRHVRWLHAKGFRVTGVDRDLEALSSLKDIAVEAWCRDIEANAWPLADRQFDAVIVTNYLWRPLWSALRASVKPGGWLIYETFGITQPQFGRPTRPEFLLEPGELLRVFADWHVMSFEEGLVKNPLRHVQRIAVQSPSGDLMDPMHRLPPEIAEGEG